MSSYSTLSLSIFSNEIAQDCCSTKFLLKAIRLVQKFPDHSIQLNVLLSLFQSFRELVIPGHHRSNSDHILCVCC